VAWLRKHKKHNVAGMRLLSHESGDNFVPNACIMPNSAGGLSGYALAVYIVILHFTVKCHEYSYMVSAGPLY